MAGNSARSSMIFPATENPHRGQGGTLQWCHGSLRGFPQGLCALVTDGMVIQLNQGSQPEISGIVVVAPLCCFKYDLGTGDHEPYEPTGLVFFSGGRQSQEEGEDVQQSLRTTSTDPFPKRDGNLVSGLEPWNFMTFHMLGIIIPTDEYFSEGLTPPTSNGFLEWPILGLIPHP